jgi:hypothetical protein
MADGYRWRVGNLMEITGVNRGRTI